MSRSEALRALNYHPWYGPKVQGLSEGQRHVIYKFIEVYGDRNFAGFNNAINQIIKCNLTAEILMVVNQNVRANENIGT